MVMETVTCIMRFGLRMESTRDTSALAAITFNLRIHHSYLGVVGMLIGWFIWRRVNEKLGRWLVIIGIGAFASDMIHHFLVLWPIVGSPQFDFFYGLR